MIRVVVADDFTAMRRVMENLVETAEDIEIVAEAPTLEEALELIQTIDHDVIVMNDYLPPMTSARAARTLRDMDIKSPILVVSMHKDASMAREALGNGADGFLLKTELLDCFIDAIRTVYDGETFISRAVEQLLAKE